MVIFSLGAVAHPATAKQQEACFCNPCMQWILLQETRPEGAGGARTSRPPFPSPEPGSNLVKDLPRAPTRPSQPPTLPSLHSLARPESNPAPSLPLLLFRSAHVGVGARTPCLACLLTGDQSLHTPRTGCTGSDAVTRAVQEAARYRCNLRPSKPPRDRLGCEHTTQGGPPPSYNSRSPPILPCDVVYAACALPDVPERSLSYVKLREPRTRLLFLCTGARSRY